MYLLQNSKGIITDSGGVTEESTVLGVPCITLRNTTERPETVSEGTNVLVGDDMQLLKVLICDLCEGSWKESRIPILWDGFTGDRIVTILARLTN
jgi:UDP-N-acetylglucosamine 2-epimerase (non-hydrolysing)